MILRFIATTLTAYSTVFSGMAWYSSGSSNNQLVSNLVRNGVIRSREVIDAMKAVDRSNYAPSHAYEDRPTSIGRDQTISAPHMHGYAAEYLLPALKVTIDVTSYYLMITGRDTHLCRYRMPTFWMLAVDLDTYQQFSLE